jgi:hypothetical protein
MHRSEGKVAIAGKTSPRSPLFRDLAKGRELEVDSLIAEKISEGVYSGAGRNLAQASCVQWSVTGEESQMREGVYSERDHQTTQVERRLVVVVILLIALLIWRNAIAGGPEEPVCDVNADYALGSEDYPKRFAFIGISFAKAPTMRSPIIILDLPKSGRQPLRGDR